MNRNTKLPPPPSQRKGEPWRATLAAMMNELIDELLGDDTAGRQEDVRRLVINQARLAFNAELPFGDDAVIERDGDLKIVIPIALRQFLETNRVDWKSPMIAENVMGDIQRALDRRLKSARPARDPSSFDKEDVNRINFAASLLAFTVWLENGEKPFWDRDDDRDKSLRLLDEALGDTPTSQLHAALDGETWVTLAGAFRLSIEHYDFRRPDVAAAIRALAAPAIDAELSRPTPGKES